MVIDHKLFYTFTQLGTDKRISLDYRAIKSIAEQTSLICHGKTYDERTTASATETTYTRIYLHKEYAHFETVVVDDTFVQNWVEVNESFDTVERTLQSVIRFIEVV